MLILRPPPIRPSEITPEAVYLGRRLFLGRAAALGAGGLLAAGPASANGTSAPRCRSTAMPGRSPICTRDLIFQNIFDIDTMLVPNWSHLNHHPRAMLALCCSLLAAPAAMLGCDAWCGDLGPNPLETLVHSPGYWALAWLMATLLISPLRHTLLYNAQRRRWRYGKRPSDWNWLIRLRRPVGLAAFFYGLVHLALYLALDLELRWSELAGDSLGKPHIVAGMAAFLLLAPLALTSTNAWMRRLQRQWKRLHLLVYPAAMLAVLHFILLSKPGATLPYGYALGLVILLAQRSSLRWLHDEVGQDRIDGALPERPPARRGVADERTGRDG